MSTSPNPIPPPNVRSWSDEQLVRECLKGNQDAWLALLEKYRNLIYSIPIKYGLSSDDASDVFQQVCLQLLRTLPTLREPKSLAAWLIRVSSHACSHWSRENRHMQPLDFEVEHASTSGETPETLFRDVEREQGLREAMARIRPRCRELIRMLFFEIPAVPYETVAARLGLATGSIGFIRMRCLKSVRRELEQSGFS
jgi:RNA polymerase sigma factor (sigma-70 family)